MNHNATIILQQSQFLELLIAMPPSQGLSILLLFFSAYLIFYKRGSLFPHVSAAIQLGNRSNSGKYPIKGDTIQYIYTNSQHSNPLCRVVPIEDMARTIEPLLEYDKEKYRETILDAAETVLGIFGFDRTVYYDDGGSNFSSNNKNEGRQRRKRNKWYEELREERMKDIQTETS